MKHDKNENDYLNAEKMYATKFHNALKANDITLVKSLGQEIIRALPYTYRDIFDEVIRDTDSELAKKLQPIDYVAFMRDLEDGPKLYNKDNRSNNMAGKKFDLLTDYIHDLYSPSSDEEKRKLEIAQKEADDYFNHIAKTDDSIPGYENVSIDAGVLSGMLTDSPEIRKATLAWMNNLPEIDANAIKRVIASKEFRDMYGDLDFDWKGNKNYRKPETDDYAQGFADVQNSDDPTAPAGKSNRYYDGWNDGLFEKNNTKVGGIAKALTANDLGRSL